MFERIEGVYLCSAHPWKIG